MCVLTLCKSEPEDLKQALSQLITNIPQNTPQRNRLIKIGCCVLKNRRLSAQEAAYRLSDLHLIHSSRTVVSLNTKPPELRYRVLKPKKDRDELPENSTDIFCYNILDYYRSRPLSYEDTCFYEFAMWFVKCEKPIQLSPRANIRIQLLSPFSNIYMRKREKSLILRMPKLSIATDAYFYSLLLRFLPHRQENNILSTGNGQFKGAREAFIAKQQYMSLEFLQSFSIIDEIENAVSFIRCSRIELEASLTPATAEIDCSIECENEADISFTCTQSNVMSEYFTSHYNLSDDTNLHELSVCTISKDNLIITNEQNDKLPKNSNEFFKVALSV